MDTPVGNRSVLLAVVLSSCCMAGEPDALLEQLESVPTAVVHAYQLRDNNGRSMDCLKVLQPRSESYNGVYGVYHSRQDGVFSIHLARSMDLLNWTHVTPLDEHASQATIWQCDSGAYFVAYEKDEPNSVWIRVRFYKDLSDLRSGTHGREFDIPRTLAPTAEGTPSFESVTLPQDNLDMSRIELRFHYFKEARVDQLAGGTLTNFKSWKAESLDDNNAELIRRGWRGNLGDRDKFTWKERSFYLQEVQRTRGDWSSWRVCLCDEEGMPIRVLSIRTHSGSAAFSNPSATWITNSKGQRVLAITLFLPSDGNDRDERGTLMYAIAPSDTLNASHE